MAFATNQIDKISDIFQTGDIRRRELNREHALDGDHEANVIELSQPQPREP